MRPYQAHFNELAQDMGCYLHDPLPDLLQYPIHQRREFRYQNDSHLKREGHQALAASLAPTIQRIKADTRQDAGSPDVSGLARPVT